MATIKSYTDLEQSRKLAEILPLESADIFCADVFNKEEGTHSYNFHILSTWGCNTFEELKDRENKFVHFIPCWSLATLRNLLPVGIKISENTYLFESHNTFDKSWVYRYYDENDTSYLYCKNVNEVDACVAMIEKLNELNLL